MKDKGKVIIIEIFMLLSLCGLIIVFEMGLEVWPVVLKSLTSILFVAAGFLGASAAGNKTRFSKLMLAAFLCSMAGDVMLALDKDEGILFVLGVALFASAHVLFSIAYASLMPMRKWDILMAVGIFILLLLILCLGTFDFKGLFPVLVGYAAVISFMVTKALLLLKRLKESKAAFVCIAVGGVLFLLSDILLLYWLFGIDTPKEVQSVNWVFYYAAQGFLTFSLAVIKLERHK